MEQAIFATRPARVHVRSMVALLYAFGAFSMALVGILSPLGGRITAALGVSPDAIGLTIGLFSLPTALAATFGGGLIDRIGPRRVLLVAPLLVAVGDLLFVLAPSMLAFNGAMLLVGIGYVGIVISVPAMLIGSLEGCARTRAMALWSTNSPLGFSLGLLMAAPFADALNWRIAIAVHGLLMLAFAAAATMLLPHVARALADPASGPRARVAGLFAAIRNPQAVRLALAVAMPNMISYGTSLISVSYLARVHGVSLAASATTVAVAKIAAILVGGTLSGALLARRVAPRRLFAGVVAIGLVAQFLLYLPASPLPVAIGGLMLWLFAFGCQSGICMAMMASLTGASLRGGVIAGVVNQMISVASFLTPAIYFAMPGWFGFVALAMAGALASIVLLPAPRPAEPA